MRNENSKKRTECALFTGQRQDLVEDEASTLLVLAGRRQDLLEEAGFAGRRLDLPCLVEDEARTLLVLACWKKTGIAGRRQDLPYFLYTEDRTCPACWKKTERDLLCVKRKQEFPGLPEEDRISLAVCKKKKDRISLAVCKKKTGLALLSVKRRQD